jgi:hypothetical protein
VLHIGGVNIILAGRCIVVRRAVSRKLHLYVGRSHAGQLAPFNTRDASTLPARWQGDALPAGELNPEGSAAVYSARRTLRRFGAIESDLASEENTCGPAPHSPLERFLPTDGEMSEIDW